MDPAGEADGSLTRPFATTHGDLTYAQLADAIAPHLAYLLARVGRGEFEQQSYSDDLIRGFHRVIIGDLIPGIAGQSRGEPTT